MPEPYRNKLLQNLSPDIIERLQLRRVELPVNYEIEYPGHAIDNVYFIETGAGSMTATFQDGSQVEIGLFGYESAMGVSALMGTRRSLNRVYMQIGGFGFKSTVDHAKAEFHRNGDFHRLTLRYVQAQLTQATQSAGCNAKHSVEQRLARWLLLCADRANSATFTISQEFLGDMLGVNRTSVSSVAHELKSQGLIDYRRAEMHILDMAGLEKRSCECYRTVKEHLDNYLEFENGFTV